MKETIKYTLEKNVIKEKNLNQLQDEIKHLKKEIKRMRRSFSWRITFPFRALRVLGTKIFYFRKNINLLAENIKLEGGLIKFIKHTYQHIRDFNIVSFFYGLTIKNISYIVKYETWFKRYGLISIKQTNIIKRVVKKEFNNIKISIVIFVNNQNKEYLTESIETIKKQIHPNWELFIVTNIAPNLDINRLLDDYTQKDKRIKRVICEEDNKSNIVNKWLSRIKGKFVIFLDSHELLTNDALFWIAHTASKKPEMALFYSDEDKLDEQGKHCKPLFKPNFNKELLFAYNYLSNLTAFKKEIVDELEEGKKDLNKDQKYDFTLRYIETIKEDQIIHFPKILCHCRIIEGKVDINNEQANTEAAGEKALNNYFFRNKISAIAHFNKDINVYETHYILSESPLVSIIIPTKNGHELVTQCIESIYQKTSYNNFEVILIDNNSDHYESITCFSDLKSCYSNLHVIKDPTTPFNYSRINNSAAKNAKGDFLLFLNNDTKVINSEWLTEMVAIGQQQNVGAVGAKLFYPNNTLQHAGVIIGVSGVPWLEGVADHVFKGFDRDTIGYMARTHVMQCYSAVTAACLLVSKEHFFLVGGLNEVELGVAFNDVDLCLKLQEKGLRNIWTPHAKLYHYESISRGSDDESPEKRERSLNEAKYMCKRWNTNIQEDPCYNPNLSLLDACYSIVKPRVDFFSELNKEV